MPRLPLVLLLTLGCEMNDPSDNHRTAMATAEAAVAVVRVASTPSDTLAVGPVGAAGFVLTGTAFDAASQPVPGIVLAFWENTAAFAFSGGLYCTTGADGRCSKTVTSTAVGVGKAILRHNGGTARRDTVQVKVQATAPGPPPPPPTLAAIGVTPATATLAPGGAQSFSATDTLSDGTTRPFAGAWTATGGTISGSGVYTAGSVVGAYEVVATEGSEADTAAVTISDAPPPPPPPPDASAHGCSESGYLRLVDVSTDAQFTAALAAALPGDQIRLAAGSYSANRTWSRSGTASQPITVCGLPGVGPVIVGVRFVSTGSWVTFAGLVFDGNLQQENVVYLHDCHDAIFSGNEIKNGRYHAGLAAKNTINLRVAYNYIHDNGVDHSTDHGIYWKSTPGAGNRIDNNLIARNAARGISLHDNTNVGVFDVLVAHNTVVHNGSQGIKLHQGDRNIIVNNLVAFNGDLNNQSQIRIEKGSGNNQQVRNNLTYSLTASRAGIQNQTTSPMSGNIVAAPQLVSATDWHITAGSPAIGLGLPAYTVTPDYDGAARTDGAPDAGAYER